MAEKQINETHLGYIQNTIDRMSRNSFQSKAWCITIVSALTALYLSDRNKGCLLIAIAASVLFLLLDMYYLYLEKGYRNLYNVVARINTSETVKDYSMTIPKSYRGICKYLKSFLSVSTGVFYGAIIVILSIFYKFTT